jgi:NTP pyrophosphatase (non-canonical NTP hydrolase)
MDLKGICNYWQREAALPLEMDEYAVKANKYARYPNRGDNLDYVALGLAGEVGEFCGELSKIKRDREGIITQTDRDYFIEELGDILWFVAATAQELDVDLNEVAVLNLNKLCLREEARKALNQALNEERSKL